MYVPKKKQKKNEIASLERNRVMTVHALQQQTGKTEKLTLSCAMLMLCLRRDDA